MAKSMIKTTTRKIQEALRTNDLEAAKKEYIEYVSLVDKAVSKGTFHRNTAARKKSRLSKRIKGVATA